MIKKHILLIAIISLLVIAAIVLFKIELERYRIERGTIVDVCRGVLLGKDMISEDLKNARIGFFPGQDYASVTFSYRDDEAFCKVHRNGSEWEVTSAGFFGMTGLP